MLGIKKKKMKNRKSNITDGTSNAQDIVHVSKSKFLQTETDDGTDNGEEVALINKIKDIWVNSMKFHLQISVKTLKKYCSSLKLGMGHDEVQSKFLKIASNAYLNNVDHLMNASFNHCLIPHEILKGDTNPSVKDIKGNMTESLNYI